MKSFKLMTLTAALLTSAAFISTSAVAGTYSTTISITDLDGNLSWSETNGMQFPQLLLDGLTVVGDSCYTYHTSSSLNALCPGNRDNVSNSVFAVTGIPNAAVEIQLDGTPSVIEGIHFAPYNQQTTMTIDGDGNATHEVGGYLKLVDRSLIVSNSITFSYNLEFSAQ